MGSIVGVIVAGTAIAAIIATARINNNSVVSPLIEAPPPPPPTIAVAIEADFNNCSASLNYEEISSTTLFSGSTLDYSDPYGSPLALSSFESGFLCVKNLSTDTPYGVNLTLENVVSFDLGCDTDEVAAGDTDCDSPGDPGELGDGALVLNFNSFHNDPSNVECVPFDVNLLDQTLAGITYLEPSDWCAWDIWLWDTNAYLSGVDPDPIYSSDDVTFDIVLQADDGVVP